MRALLWLLLLFALAVVLALLTGTNQAVVTIYWPPNKAIDFSLNFAVLALMGLLVLVQLLLRATSALRHLPQQAKRWRTQQRERAMHGHLLDALSFYLSGRFARARKSAHLALRHDAELYGSHATPAEAAPSAPAYRTQLRLLAQFMVAQGSHALQDAPERDKAMQQAQTEAATARGEGAQEARDGLALRAARWALDDHAPNHTLRLLESLPQGTARRIQALRIKLQAARELGKTDMALETGRALVRHKAFSEEAGKVLMTRLAVDQIASACDPDQLHALWKKLDKTERAQPAVALRAARRMMELGGDVAQARIWLLPVWERYAANPADLTGPQRSQLINTLQSGTGVIDSAWLQRIEETHLRHPQQADLHYLMGMACLQKQLWGKAQQLLTQATQAPHQDPALLRNAWRALATLAEARNDTAQALHAWKQAALVGEKG